jgi:TRAP-type mannitol/chloroaromatic compound transport system permease small subunit
MSSYVDIIKKYSLFFNKLLSFFAIVSGFLIVFVIITVSFEMISRHLFSLASVWVVELVEYSLLYITFLSTAWLLRNDGHVKMDVFYLQLNKKVQHVFSLISKSICAMACFILTIYGVKSVITSYEMAYKTATELELPQYIILMVIPLGFFLLFLEFIVEILLKLLEKNR